MGLGKHYTLSRISNFASGSVAHMYRSQQESKAGRTETQRIDEKKKNDSEAATNIARELRDHASEDRYMERRSIGQAPSACSFRLKYGNDEHNFKEARETTPQMVHEPKSMPEIFSKNGVSLSGGMPDKRTDAMHFRNHANALAEAHRLAQRRRRNAQ